MSLDEHEYKGPDALIFATLCDLNHVDIIAYHTTASNAAIQFDLCPHPWLVGCLVSITSLRQ